MRWVARAIEMSETRGFIKAVIDADSGEILRRQSSLTRPWPRGSTTCSSPSTPPDP
jgi:hypothetical protein